RTLRELRTRLPEWLAAAPEMPQLVHTYLKKAAAGDFDAAHESALVARVERAQRDAARNMSLALFGATAIIATVLIHALGIRASFHAQWLLEWIGVAAG